MTKLLALLVFSVVIAGCSHQTESSAAQRGGEHIQYYGCGSCHTIPGIPGAHATVGPPLDRMGVRTYIAGTLPNTPQNLASWIQHPHQAHPGTAMPEMGVTPADAGEIAQYLETLR
ncbi:MAG TPA: c-type cytochrome [Terracidiphilus sp.]|nr:c-type cytochrome [Terracidiphilus sp.]